jgi:ParB-like chromosome segregation protein Spo0J
MDIKIDPEFEGLLPRTSEYEDEMLEANLIASGGPDESIKVWRDGGNVIVDGHRRYAACVKHGLMYDVEELSFPDREAVKEWMLLRQRSRRNLSDIDRVVIDNELVKIETSRAGERGAISRVAEQTNQSVSAVSRSVKAAAIIEKLPAKAKEKIKTGAVVAGKKSIEALGALPAKEKAKAVGKIVSGKAPSVAAALPDTSKVCVPKKPKAARADADMPERYVDDYGNVVPEEHWPAWRKKSDIMRITNTLLSAAAEMDEIAEALGSSSMKSVAAKQSEVLASWRGQTPALIKGGMWFSREFADKQEKSGG